MPAEMNWLDKAISFVSPSWAHSRLQYRKAIEASARFRGASSDRLRSDWNLSKRDPTPDTWELEKLRNRTRDIACNDAVGAAVIDTYGYNVVGSGLKFESRVNHELLGISAERGEEIRHAIEAVWEESSKQADHAGILTFDELQFMALRKVLEDGEVFAIPSMRDDPWRKVKRTLQLVEADFLERSGFSVPIEVDSGGRPLKYWFKEVEPNKFGGYTTKGYRAIDALDSEGRRKVYHLYRPTRPGQLRGVSILAPILTLLKDFCDTREAYIVKERVQACLTVIFTKRQGNPAFEALTHGTGTEDTTGTPSNRLQSLEPGLVYYNSEGDDVSMLDPGKTGDGQQAFIDSCLRLIGAAVQVPYELLVKDFSKTTYSSARAALLEGRRAFAAWRKWLPQKLNQPYLELTLEEAVLRGLIDLPGFFDRKSIYCAGQWVGAGWGWIQPVQEIEASRRAVDYGLSTLAEENAAQGRDWEDTVSQNAIENAYIDRKGALITRAQKNAHKTDDNQQPEKEKNERGQDDDE